LLRTYYREYAALLDKHGSIQLEMRGAYRRTVVAFSFEGPNISFVLGLIHCGSRSPDTPTQAGRVAVIEDLCADRLTLGSVTASFRLGLSANCREYPNGRGFLFSSHQVAACCIELGISYLPTRGAEASESTGSLGRTLRRRTMYTISNGTRQRERAAELLASS
jgi:hypothetical protein